MSLKNLFKTKYIYVYIFLYNLGLFFLSTENYKYLLMRKDQEIMVMTAAKMFYFDMNTFEAAWNHHTPPIFYFFKLIFQFTDFVNVYEGFFVLYSALLISINILLYKLIYKLTNSNFVSLLFSSLFIFDISHTTAGEAILFDNRTIGIVFQILLLLYSFKIIENLNQKNVVIWSLITSICVFFLESYAVSLLIIYVFLVYKLGKFFLIYSQTTFFLSTTIYGLILHLNNELYETIQLNYIFHLFGTIRKRLPLEVLLNNGLFKESDPVSWSSLFFILSVMLLVLFVFVEKFKNIYKTKKLIFEIVYIFFLAEIIHLIFSGPRFINYFQIILLFVYLLPIVTLFYLFRSFKKQEFIMFLSFMFLFFMFSYDNLNEILLYRFNNHQQVSNLNSEQKELVDYINKNNSDSPEIPSLNYIWGFDNNFEVYLRTNSLPSTRMWWWFNMYYVESSGYIFDSDRFYSKNFEDLFIGDLNKEKPKFIVIQKNFISQPYFLKKHIEENYLLSHEIEGFKIYKINN